MSVQNTTFSDNNPPACDAAWLNSVVGEVNNTVTSTGVSTDDGNLNQLAAAVAEYTAGADYYNETGVADAYVVSPVGAKAAPTQYFAGMRVRFIVGNTSTGASTINVNGLGIETIVQPNGTDPITSGDFTAGTEVQLTYDGTNFRAVLGIPVASATFAVGSLIAYAGTSAPSGWLLCDGSDVSRATYSVLFGQVATAYGVGDGATTFTLPDYRGRALVGLDNLGGASANRLTDTNADSLNNTGLGAETDTGTNGTTGSHSLSIAEMPAHTHDVPTYVTSSGTTPHADRVNLSVPDGLTYTTNSTGSGTAHTHPGSTITMTTGANAQPSLAAGIIIKF